MNYARIPGPGDEATWSPYAGHPLDPRAPLDDCDEVPAPRPLEPTEIDAWAQAIVHDADELDALQAGPLNYSLLWVKVDGRYRNIYQAYEAARLRSMGGRHDEAESIHRDITEALLSELRRLIVAGKIDRRTR